MAAKVLERGSSEPSGPDDWTSKSSTISHPPGLIAITIRSSARSGSDRCSRTRRAYAMSNVESGSGSVRMSCRRTSTLPRPIVARNRVSMSVVSTNPCAPTRCDSQRDALILPPIDTSSHRPLRGRADDGLCLRRAHLPVRPGEHVPAARHCRTRTSSLVRAIGGFEADDAGDLVDLAALRLYGVSKLLGTSRRHCQAHGRELRRERRVIQRMARRRGGNPSDCEGETGVTIRRIPDRKDERCLP